MLVIVAKDVAKDVAKCKNKVHHGDLNCLIRNSWKIMFYKVSVNCLLFCIHSY